MLSAVDDRTYLTSRSKASSVPGANVPNGAKFDQIAESLLEGLGRRGRSSLKHQTGRPTIAES
jgi:hypothetical protein